MNRPRVTVVLLNYRRPNNLATIVDSLRRQTVPADIFLWDNSELERPLPAVDWTIRSSKNVFCWPRWFLAAQAATDYVLCMDDDLTVCSDDTLEQLVHSLDTEGRPGRIIGIEGVILDGCHPYFPLYGGKVSRTSADYDGPGSIHIHAPANSISVDVVKGRFAAFRQKDIVALPLRVRSGETCDDIAVSALLPATCGVTDPRPHVITHYMNGKLRDLEDKNGPMALSKGSDWRSVRNEAKAFYYDGQPC